MSNRIKNIPYIEDDEREVALANVRNIGIMAHIDAGKTTLTERILFYTGVNRRMGEVHDGTTTMDFMSQEQERGITISSAAITCLWHECRINIIDTPGHVDFTAEVERSLRVLDGAVAVFCAVSGVQSQSQTVWGQAKKYKIPVVAFINKMDADGADFQRVVKDIVDKLGATPIPVQLPFFVNEKFVGVIDLLQRKLLQWNSNDFGVEVLESEIPDSWLVKSEKAREYLIECLAELDELIMNQYLLDEEPTVEQLAQALRRVTINCSAVPVTCGTAFKNRGVQPLLDTMVKYLPSPVDIWQVEGKNIETNEKIARHVGDTQPFSAVAFKVITDPYLGKLVFFRVYSGTAIAGMCFLNPRTGEKQRLGRLLQVHANRTRNRKKIFSGDIAAIVGLANTETGDTLCDLKFPILLDSVQFPSPVVSMAVEPKSCMERDKLLQALKFLSHEDPTFRVQTDTDTGQTVIAGMGELHLEIIKDRLFRDFDVRANVGKPQVAYRESILAVAEVDTTFERTVAGRSQYAHLQLRVEPRERGYGVVVENQLTSSMVPVPYHLVIENRIKESCECSVLAAYPLIDVHFTIFGGSFNTVESSIIAFEIVASMAVREAILQANPYLLEPIMITEIITPEEYVGDIIGDLSSRRGHIVEVDAQARISRVIGKVPLAELFGYATALRSLTKGQAGFVAEASHFERVSDKLQNELLTKV